ncbi:MAG: Crp/Fnr family transcriptional regulator [Pseudomonadota bacterium]
MTRPPLTTRFEDPAVSALMAGMGQLSETDHEAMRHLKVVHRFIGRQRSLIHEGDPIRQVRIICKGWAIRSRRLDQTRRQILDVALPGDIVGLHLDGKSTSICDVEALTPCEVGEIDADALERVAHQNRGVASSLHQNLTCQLARANDQVLRLGRMTAYERVCSFLMDIYDRQRLEGALRGHVDFPITQAIVADLLGLSVVHVNRQVMRLRREGLVSLQRRQLVIHDEQRMTSIASGRAHMVAAE